MSLHEQLKEKKKRGELSAADLTEEVLKTLFWDEELITKQIGDLFDLKHTQVRSLIAKYDLQLYNKRSLDLASMFSKVAAASELKGRMESRLEQNVSMVNVIISCARCGHAVVLNEDEGKKSFVGSKLNDDGNFSLFIATEESIDPEVTEEFVESLSSAKDTNELKEILEKDIPDNVDFDSRLDQIMIKCTGCGDYLDLVGFYE
ncbi:hypothetical protein [Paenibacillus contaminans]|uniref:Uncharacterized protein n=1 Tax=Paenibacillus contaminans TaxID=450362 RepID=A0A329MQM6_9BACL|nr:hypothetical protein [Paenibacillus contaminans]RAV22239.1 hypothetical protein DQG23_04610 [Paenibacillus contaminans]